MPSRSFVREVVISLILLDRPAKSYASLYASVSRIRNRTERVDGLELAIAEKAEDVAVELVRAGAGDDVDYASGGASIFRFVVVSDDLEFLPTLTRLERARWPLMLSPEVGAAPVLGALSRTTRESVSVKLM